MKHSSWTRAASRSSKLLAWTLVGADQALLFLLGIDPLSIRTMIESVARFLTARALLPAARRSP